MVTPVFVTFKVSLVHHVKSVVVEHGIHFGLTWVVAGAHGVNIGLLHECNVLEHGGYVNGTTTSGVRVLRVNTSKVNLLAVDVNSVVVGGNFDVAETIFCSKGFLFISVGIKLSQFNGVKMGLFSTPQFKV